MRKVKGTKGIKTNTYEFKIVIQADNLVSEKRMADYLTGEDFFRQMTVSEFISIEATNKESKAASAAKVDDLPF